MGQQETCHTCKATDHFMAYCPQALCRGCQIYGHTRKVCPTNPYPPQHSTRMLRAHSQDRGTDEYNRFARNPMRNMVRKLDTDENNKTYLQIECMETTRNFLLDSGCDITLLPTEFVKGLILHPSTKKLCSK